MRASGSGMARTLQCTDVGLQPASTAGVGVVVGVGVAVGVGCVVVAPLSLCHCQSLPGGIPYAVADASRRHDGCQKCFGCLIRRAQQACNIVPKRSVDRQGAMPYQHADAIA